MSYYRLYEKKKHVCQYSCQKLLLGINYSLSSYFLGKIYSHQYLFLCHKVLAKSIKHYSVARGGRVILLKG